MYVVRTRSHAGAPDWIMGNATNCAVPAVTSRHIAMSSPCESPAWRASPPQTTP
jgi:hypothetical protein